MGSWSLRVIEDSFYPLYNELYYSLIAGVVK